MDVWREERVVKRTEMYKLSVRRGTLAFKRN